MKALTFIVCGLICLASIRVLDPNPVPLSIDGAMIVQAGGDWCDVPKARKPVLDSPRHKLDYRQGAPYGDKGIA